jgi:uncharacterized RDD family membrane protein YckC
MRNFSARETEWLQELDGIELAPFVARAAAFLIDWALVSIVLSAVLMGSLLGYFKYRKTLGLPTPKTVSIDLRPNASKFASDDPELFKRLDSEFVHILVDVAVPVLYFGLFTWKGKGRSPGKRIVKIRVVSLVHRHLTLWHSIERALGYGAAALEGGFGFVQFFIHPYRRCVQDRIAETIVVTERGYQLMQKKAAHPLLPDVGEIAELNAADESLPTTH